MYYRDHSIDWTGAESYADIIDQYGVCTIAHHSLMLSDNTLDSRPLAPYIIDLATTLQTMANQAGYTSALDVADFIHAFVGDVQYVYDLDDAGEQSEYPKYPIEMLWEQGGDCENASASTSALF